MVAGEQQFTRPLLEANGPVEWLDLLTAPRVRVQVMHEVTAAHDEHPFVAQAVEALRGLVVDLCRLRLVNAELDNRHVCCGEDVTEHRPCAMVEPPTLV